MQRWTEKERAIFQFEDGTGATRYADPLAVRRRLGNLLVDVNAVLRDSRSTDDNVAEPAIFKLRIACCDVFKLGMPLDWATGQGVADATWIRVLNDYLEYLEGNGSAAAS